MLQSSSGATPSFSLEGPTIFREFLARLSLGSTPSRLTLPRGRRMFTVLCLYPRDDWSSTNWSNPANRNLRQRSAAPSSTKCPLAKKRLRGAVSRGVSTACFYCSALSDGQNPRVGVEPAKFASNRGHHQMSARDEPRSSDPAERLDVRPGFSAPWARRALAVFPQDETHGARKQEGESLPAPVPTSSRPDHCARGRSGCQSRYP
jgi:hypothetical protein